MKKLIILISLVTISFSADKWGIEKPVNEGYILYPTISYSITGGHLKSTETDITSGSLGAWNGYQEFGKETNFNIILPITKHLSLIYNSNTVAGHESIYYYNTTYHNITHSSEKATLGMKVSFSPDMFDVFKK